MMELEKTPRGGALVKAGEKQHKVAVGLGAVGIMMLPFGIHPVLALAASLGAILLSWESATSSEKRTALATAAFAMGTIPLALKVAGLVAGGLLFMFKIAILAVIVGGVYYGGRTVYRRMSGNAEPA